MSGAQIFYFDTDPALLSSQLGVANGVASLDGTGRLSFSQIPAGLTTGLDYKGVFDPATNLVGGTLLLETGAELDNVVQPAGAFVIVASSAPLSAAVDGIAQNTVMNAGAKLVSNGTAWEYVDDAEVVTTAQIIDSAVTAPKIAADAVTTVKILDANVTAAKLATDSVQTAKIVDLNVTTGKIADGAVTALKLATNAVETAKILDANVTAAKLATDSVQTAKIVDLNVTTAKLADDAVTTAKIANANVTTDKILNANVTAAKLATDSVETAKIVDANVTAAKLATDSVQTAKIVDLNVTTAKLADSAVTALKLATDSVQTAKIVDANVTDVKLASNSVTTAKILDLNVTRPKLETLTTSSELLAPYPAASLTLFTNGSGGETLTAVYDTTDGTTPQMTYRATKTSGSGASTYKIYVQWRIPATLVAWTGSHVEIRYKTSSTSTGDASLAADVYAGTSSATKVGERTEVASSVANEWATATITFGAPGALVRPTQKYLSLQLLLTVTTNASSVSVGNVTFNYTEKVGL